MFMDLRKKTEEMPADLENLGKYEETWQISAWIARVSIIQYWFIIDQIIN